MKQLKLSKDISLALDIITQTPRGTLVSKGLIRYPVPGSVALTPVGSNLANIPEAIGSEQDLHKRILARLTGPQAHILKLLIEARGEPISNEILTEKAGYTNPSGELRSFGLIDYPTPGMVVARPILFI